MPDTAQRKGLSWKIRSRQIALPDSDAVLIIVRHSLTYPTDLPNGLNHWYRTAGHSPDEREVVGRPNH